VGLEGVAGEVCTDAQILLRQGEKPLLPLPSQATAGQGGQPAARGLWGREEEGQTLPGKKVLLLCSPLSCASCFCPGHWVTSLLIPTTGVLLSLGIWCHRVWLLWCHCC
jgi:hypothetical protein